MGLPSPRECNLARLLCIKGADEGKQFELTEGTFTVGRDATSDFRLHDTEVSRRHADFSGADGSWSLVDKGSANGTFVNNHRVETTNLQPGDQIHLGQTILVFSGSNEESSEEAGDLAEKISLITR